MSACLSITLSCGKMFHSRKPIYHPQELFLFYLGLWQNCHPRNRFIIHKSFFSFTWGRLWKEFHPQNRFIIYESLFFFSFGLWKIRVKSVRSFRAVIGIAVVVLLLPSHRRPRFDPLPSHCVRVSSLPPPLLPAAFPVTFLRHFLAISIIAGQVLISSSCYCVLEGVLILVSFGNSFCLPECF